MCPDPTHMKEHLFVGMIVDCEFGSRGAKGPKYFKAVVDSIDQSTNTVDLTFVSDGVKSAGVAMKGLRFCCMNEPSYPRDGFATAPTPTPTSPKSPNSPASSLGPGLLSPSTSDDERGERTRTSNKSLAAPNATSPAPGVVTSSYLGKPHPTPPQSGQADAMQMASLDTIQVRHTRPGPARWQLSRAAPVSR